MRPWPRLQHYNRQVTCGQSPASSCLGRSSPQQTDCRGAPSLGPPQPDSKVFHTFFLIYIFIIYHLSLIYHLPICLASHRHWWCSRGWCPECPRWECCRWAADRRRGRPRGPRSRGRAAWLNVNSQLFVGVSTTRESCHKHSTGNTRYWLRSILFSISIYSVQH